MKKKNVKKMLRDTGILTGVFIIAVLVFSYVTNKSNDNMTVDIGTATYPQISFGYNGYALNTVPGYAQEMDIPSIRDTLTPVLDKKTDVEVRAYDNRIEKLTYQVYSLDGEKKFVEKEVGHPSEKVTLDLSRGNMTREEKVLKITLSLEGGKDIFFYTRIKNAENASMAECLDYAKNFHEGALAKADGAGVGKAIEPSDEGDNSSFTHVTIHSDYDHVTYGGLEPDVEGGERWSVKEMNDATSSVQTEFLISCKGEENERDLYKVKEFFRIRHDKQAKKTYLLDYDRVMEQIFNPTKQVLSEKGVLLGVANRDLQYMTNKDGTIVSFVQADELWNYNKETDEVALVFSFAFAENTDSRNLTSQHEIRLLECDDNGNVTFAVYGYMNRGEHEGEVGVAVYYYNIEENSVGEKVFIPTDTSYAHTVNELGRLVYYSVERETLYVLVDGVFYETDVKKGSTKEMVQGLEEGQYVVSEDGRLMAYQEMEEKQAGGKIVVVDFSTGKQRTVEAKKGESIHPLGFVKNDFVYGISREKDKGQTVSGESVVPMYKVEIQNSKSEVVKTYEQKNIFIMGAELEENRVILERAVKEKKTYTIIGEEYISNNEETKESNIYPEVYTTELKRRQLRLTYNDGISDKEPKVLKPKQVLFENPTTVTFAKTDKDGKYYAYGHGELLGDYNTVGDAILAADEFGGVVTDENQKYVWERGNRDLVYQARSVETLAKRFAKQLKDGASPKKITEEYRDGACLDLTGCKAEQLAYIINQGSPVIGMCDAKKAIILISYNETTMTYIDVESGKKHAADFEKIDKMTAGSGHTYIS